MGKIHKDIAMFMVDAAKNEEYNDQKLVKVILDCSIVSFQKK